MVTTIDEADARRIEEAIRLAEAGTRAELVCVMARRSSSYEFFPLVWAAAIALATPAILLPATLWSAKSIYLIQLGLFAASLAALSVPAIRYRLVPRWLKRRRAHRAAAEQFLLRGLSRKADRTGVLIFVSLAERYARVIADVGVAGEIAPARWSEAIAMLIRHAREGRVVDGYCAAVGLCGGVLAEHFPPAPESANQLPNRFFVI